MTMRVALLILFVTFGLNKGLQPRPNHRLKRSAVGALHIVTNHAQPIHADVKPENNADGLTEKVTPPEDSIYQLRSLRKSLPLANKLDLIRSINRVVTVFVLLVSFVFEFYPLLQHLYYVVNHYMDLE